MSHLIPRFPRQIPRTLYSVNMNLNKCAICGVVIGVVALTTNELNPIISDRIGPHIHQNHVIYISSASPLMLNIGSTAVVTGIAPIIINLDTSH